LLTSNIFASCSWLWGLFALLSLIMLSAAAVENHVKLCIGLSITRNMLVYLLLLCRSVVAFGCKSCNVLCRKALSFIRFRRRLYCFFDIRLATSITLHSSSSSSTDDFLLYVRLLVFFQNTCVTVTFCSSLPGVFLLRLAGLPAMVLLSILSSLCQCTTELA
jgi:hypothetical protein